MVNLILKECMSRGILLDKEVFGMLSYLGDEVALEVVGILGEIGERVVTRKIFDEHSDKFEKFFGVVEVVKSEGVKVLSDVKFKAGKVEVGDFVRHFRSRYEALREILVEKNFDNLSSIRRIGVNSGVYTIVAMVTSKRITKNKNLLLEVEDLTGNSIVLVNKENRVLFEEAQGLMLDDVVVFRVSGSSKMLFANEIVFPDAGLESERFGDDDEYVAFSGDFHVGSKNFLESSVLKFVDWLNGEVGDERQRAIALKVKYLFLAGDSVDGIGNHPGQEGFLNIKSCRGQYRKLEEVLRKIRGDVQIVICAGQHDAVWVGEPQRVVSEKWAGGLHKMGNVHLVANPSFLEVDGFKILMYHGASINHFISEMDELRVSVGHGNPTRVVKEMLKRRHLAPTHGLMDYVPCEEKDGLVVDVVPDIVVTGDQHRAEVDSYNNILLVAGSCWQSVTPFEEKVGNVPEPCKVPLFNLKTREVKIIDFGEDEIRWEEGDDLVCDISRGVE
jgi:DNA polymerase II small subunit